MDLGAVKLLAQGVAVERVRPHPHTSFEETFWGSGLAELFCRDVFLSPDDVCAGFQQSPVSTEHLRGKGRKHAHNPWDSNQKL